MLHDFGFLLLQEPTVSFEIIDGSVAHTLAGINIELQAAQVQLSESPWKHMFPVLSEASASVVLDTTLDPRFSSQSYVVNSPYLRFMAFCPVYFEDIVLGGIFVASTVPKSEFPVGKLEILTSFSRILSEIIACEAKRRRKEECKYLEVLTSWPRSLLEPFQNIVASFRDIDDAVYKLLSLKSVSTEVKDESEESMESMSRFLAESHVRLDVLRALGMMLREFLAFVESANTGSASRGLKPIKFSGLISKINEAVIDFGCEKNFNLTIDQTAESLVTVSTFVDTIGAIFRCMFSFLDMSEVALNVLCVVVVDRLDFNDCVNSEASSVAGYLCFEFVATGTYIPSESFASLWGKENENSGAEKGEADCPTDMFLQFAWIEQMLVRLGGGISRPENNDRDKKELNSCLSVSIWFPCQIGRSELVRSKEILLNSLKEFRDTPRSPVIEMSNFSFAPSDLIDKGSSVPVHHAVLVIDDSVLVQKVFMKIFGSLGIECEVASNGVSGLELMKTRHFDIVFVDFIMPEQGGVSTIQLFSEWRMNKLYSSMFVTGSDSNKMSDLSSFDDPLLIVGMSGTFDEVAVQEGFRNGIRVFLMKPVTKDKCKQIYDAKIQGTLNTEYAGRQLSDLPHNFDVTTTVT